MTDLPQNWSAFGEDLDAAEAEGLTLEEITIEEARFVDYWRSNGERKADWSATWRNWCRRFIDRKKQDAEAERRRAALYAAQKRKF